MRRAGLARYLAADAAHGKEVALAVVSQFEIIHTGNAQAPHDGGAWGR